MSESQNNNVKNFSAIFTPLTTGGNKRSYVLKQTCTFQLQVCLSVYDLLLPPDIKGIMSKIVMS